MEILLLGTGGLAATGVRETACTLVRAGDRALLLDLGTGAGRLVADPSPLAGRRKLEIVLTHFHLDHVCGLTYLTALPLATTIWAPGAWLYRADSASLLRPLRVPPVSPTDVRSRSAVRELREGRQTIAGFEVRAVAQPRHWAPTAGLRVEDAVALVTDTPYEPASAALAEGVAHLLHEAWSPSSAPVHADRDATGADAARVAAEAGVQTLTLIHLNPASSDHAPVLVDALRLFERTRLGEDGTVLAA